MLRIVMIGDGGHGKVVRELIALMPDVRLAAALDDRYSGRDGALPAGAQDGADGEFRGPVEAWRSLLARYPALHFIVAIGDNRTRREIARELEAAGARFARLIHPAATVSPKARIGPGAVVMARAVVQPDAEVGAHAIVNTGAIVEHDCAVGDYAHIAPGAVMTGGARAGEGALLGAGAVILPGRTVGAWAAAGAGAVVTRDVPPGCTAAGVPASVIRQAVWPPLPQSSA